MARIAGVDIPSNKRVEISLTYIFGIGRSISNKIIEKAGIDKNRRMKDLTEEEINTVRNIIEKEYKVEGDLRTENTLNKKRLMDINCYRGMRHKRGLPARGQRTKTNARTRKGRARTIAGKRKAPAPK